VSPLKRLVDLRRRATLAASEQFFRSLSRFGAMHPLANPSRHDVEVDRDLVYGARLGEEHRLDVWRPRDHRELRPAVLYVHGGGFRILSKDTHWIMALMFARAGYVVFNVNYRLAPKHPFPDGIADVCDAYRWVVQNGAAHGADVSRLILAGESAGANLVTALTLATTFQRDEPWARAVFDTKVVPKAVLPACGLLQVSEPERFPRKWPHISSMAYDQIVMIEREYLARRGDLPERTFELADPLLVLEGTNVPQRPLPAFFVACGTRDPLVDDARRLEKALHARGATCELELYPRELHAFHAMIMRKSARRCWRDTFAFLERQGLAAKNAAAHSAA
jgi:acetyl esterase